MVVVLLFVAADAAVVVVVVVVVVGGVVVVVVAAVAGVLAGGRCFLCLFLFSLSFVRMFFVVFSGIRFSCLGYFYVLCF